MRIITAGSKFLDIDAFAGCVAYAELLQTQGISAYPVSSAPWNESITKTVRGWGAPMLSKYSAQSSDTFTLIDISEPEYFDPIVAVERVDEVIDHHPGFESYWQERLGERAHIEFVGAACTLVHERWVAAGLFERMSPLSAGLLATGILDNTLNFGARITDKRDGAAYEALMAQAGLPETWPSQYFAECQAGVLADVPAALRGDSKVMKLVGWEGELAIGQLTVWDGAAVLGEHAQAVREVLSAIRPNWFMNVISVGEGTSYIACDDPALQAWLAKLLGLRFENGVARAGRMWLRKEIMKQSQEHGVAA